MELKERIMQSNAISKLVSAVALAAAFPLALLAQAPAPNSNTPPPAPVPGTPVTPLLIPGAPAQITAADLAATAPDPSGPSADGLYWFEVEMTVFSTDYGSAPFSELPLPDTKNLRYLPQLSYLKNPLDVFRFDFLGLNNSALTSLHTDLNTDLDQALATAAVDPTNSANAPAAPAVLMGPLYSPAQPEAFKLLDYEHDGFIKLPTSFSKFADVNSKLASTGEHQVLWHQVWRQPIKDRAQTPAVQVLGGEEFGEHNALEGSVRISGEGNAATLDVNLWLSSFTQAALPATEQTTLTLPERPQLEPLLTALPTASASSLTPINAATVLVPPVELGSDPFATPSSAFPSPAPTWYVSKVWHLNQSRKLTSNALHYLDHPAVAVLVEIRPYLVPATVAPLTDSNAVPAAKFE
jgi:hypothetical protein